MSDKFILNNENTSLINNLNKKIHLYKEARFISFKTYIMTVNGFAYRPGVRGVKGYIPLIDKFDYQSHTAMVKVIYDDEIYFIEDNKLHENVELGDKIVVTIKYYYDKDDKLIDSCVHHFHPYPITNEYL